MNRRPVQPLPEEIVRRIAAGEVIVRPASVTKELIENSIDAEAHWIRLEIKAGGKNLIRVTDDGIGMTRDDVRQAVARYATSKLSSLEDLTRIQSYGFRGEALASIAAISRMTIETNIDDTQTGTRLEVEGGEIKEIREVAHPRGTSVIVRALFYNLPVRRSFLKSENYELRLVAEVFRNYALAFPELGFEFLSNERLVVNLPPVNSFRERLLGLFDRKVVEGLVEFHVDNPVLSLYGFFSEPSQVKSFSLVQIVYFNHRPIRSQTVTRAVYDAYAPLSSGLHPNFVIFIQTDPSRLDVNIHPTKQEVRFTDERFLFDFVSEAVRKGLGIQRRAQLEDTGLFTEEKITWDGDLPGGFWQLHNSYIFAQVASGYVIIDQHAAHERILFEEILHRKQDVKPQGLLFPITLNLNADEFEAYERVAAKLTQMGLETKVFSGRTVIVETVPAGSFMGKDELQEFFAELVKTSLEKTIVEEELSKLLACKGAVKAGQRLTQDEMISLINRLFACREPYFCPHGRPVIIKVSIEDLDRRFGRI
ncbi:MAG: DNA mismatch repair endonuclease MutL [bacterium]